MEGLRVHIALSIAPAKMKMSLLPFTFTDTKYTYLKRRTNFPSNHDNRKN